jgi:cyclophilin family peptidyl-prolyl cis-trans isomerase
VRRGRSTRRPFGLEKVTMPSTTAKYIFFFSSGRRFVRVTARAACARLLLAMSGVYQLEPPTEGKVLLTTTHGEIEIELWSKECPKACRNFVQLCLDGYYDGCVWHRVIKDFMIQTGDPTGTGKGGESSFDDGVPFKDELHSRIKFNHRGQVAMANTGTRDTNGESFPILPRLPERPYSSCEGTITTRRDYSQSLIRWSTVYPSQSLIPIHHTHGPRD